MSGECDVNGIIPKDLKKIKIEIEYWEIKSKGGGQGNRGIKIFVKNVPNSCKEYWLSPNPHQCSAYNRHQTEFYNFMANTIINNTTFSSTGKPTWPSHITDIYWGNDYFTIS